MPFCCRKSPATSTIPVILALNKFKLTNLFNSDKMTIYCQKEFDMQAVFYSQARNNLREIINKVCDDFDEYIITTKDDKSAVILSYDEYSAMKETMYLLSSKNNRDRLNEAVDQIENLKFVKKDIDI
jgi:antitoxin YefM